MNLGSKSKRTPNRLMLVMIAASIGIHMPLLMHISGLYRSSVLSTIELTLQDISKPYARPIPRPRKRHRHPQPQNVKKLNISKHVPYMKIDPLKYASTEGTENILMPEMPKVQRPGLVNWNPGPEVEKVNSFGTITEYFDMLRLKIESKKKYPRDAMARQIQGRTIVLFEILQNGKISLTKILKSSGNRSLDKAALKAVNAVSPLPAPPLDLFKTRKQVTLTVTIVFELT